MSTRVHTQPRFAAVILIIGAAVLTLAAAACGGGSAASGSPAAPVASSAPPATSPAGQSAPPATSSGSNTGGASATQLSLSGALTGTFVPHGQYQCIPVQAIAGTIGSKQAQLELSGSHVTLLVDEGDNPAIWAGSGVSLGDSSYAFDATLDASIGATGGSLHMSGSIGCA